MLSQKSKQLKQIVNRFGSKKIAHEEREPPDRPMVDEFSL